MRLAVLAVLVALPAPGCSSGGLRLPGAGTGADAGGDTGGGSGDATTVLQDGQPERIIVVPKPCGDGLLEPERSESCDDGNTTGGDGCSGSCQLEPNGICPVPGRPCFFAGGCGDGVLQSWESCDDGNATDGDGCSGGCGTLQAGWRCPVVGRRCVPICGDGLRAGGELCDDGNAAGGDGCSETCLVEPGCECGPGLSCTCSPCIDGSTAAGISCDVPRCGDGVLSGAEECEPGAADGGDGGAGGAGGSAEVAGTYGGCTARCTFAAFCGDGLLNGPEQCDLGQALNVSPPYRRDPTAGCTPTCQAPGYCGDAVIQAAFGEQCDFGGLNGHPESDCLTNCQVRLD